MRSLFFRLYPILVWILGIITVIILIYLGNSAFLNWGAKTPFIINWDYLWVPLISISCWALAPVALGGIIYFAIQRMRNTQHTRAGIERAAIIALVAWLIIIIIAMVINFFSNNVFLFILDLCRGCGNAILVGACASVIIYFGAIVLIALFGNRGALVGAAVIIMLIVFGLRACTGIAFDLKKYKRDQIKQAQEQRAEKEASETTVIKKGKGNVTPNPYYEPVVVNNGDNNITNQPSQDDNITIIYGNGTSETGEGNNNASANANNTSTQEDVE